MTGPNDIDRAANAKPTTPPGRDEAERVGPDATFTLSDLDKLIQPSKDFLGPDQSDATPTQPVSAAVGSEPVAWRCRMNAWPTGKWAWFDHKPVLNFDIVEPPSVTSTPALAPQDRELVELAGLKIGLEMLETYRSRQELKEAYLAKIAQLEGKKSND